MSAASIFLCRVGGWGAGCNGNNHGCYREIHFSSCYPNGLVVGDTNRYTITFTTPAAVMNFLPNKQAPGPLSQDYTDPPENSELGNLASQMTALNLNVGFDSCDPSFSSAGSSLGDQVYCKAGPCSGMTVSEILTLGNQALGGTITMPYTFPRTVSVFDSYSILNACATKINQNYDNGNQDHGDLCSPGCSV